MKQTINFVAAFLIAALVGWMSFAVGFLLMWGALMVYHGRH